MSEQGGRGSGIPLLTAGGTAAFRAKEQLRGECVGVFNRVTPSSLSFDLSTLGDG